MASTDGDDEKGGGKRKLNSPEAFRKEKQKRTAPDRMARMQTLMSEVYDGIVTNDFVPQSIKDATKEMKELMMDFIRRQEDRETIATKKKTKKAVISVDEIEELLKKPLVVCWAQEKDENYEEVKRNMPAIKDLSNEMLDRAEGVLVQREEIVLIDGTNPNAQPPKKCLFLSATDWDGSQRKFEEDVKTIVRRMEKELANEVVIIAPRAWNLSAVQQRMEDSLQDMDAKCYIRGDVEQAEKIIGGKNAKTVAKQLKINVPMGEKSYAEVLSELKMNVTPGDSGVEIWRTQERKGHVKVTLKDANTERAKKLVDDINKRTSAGATVELIQKGIFVYNIEEEVTEEEVKCELDKALQSDAEGSRISVSFRTNSYGKAAMVYLEKEAAEKLCRLGFIRRSGWTNWTIKEKTNPRFSVRCQFYGHSPRDCKGDQAKSSRCMRCGECGHFQKDCSQEAFCVCCEKKGHQMNSMSCPIFKRHVEMERTKKVFR